MRSIEVRWFSEAQTSDRALRRFADDGQFEVREDLYLWGSDERVGIKLRGGRLETKRRQRSQSLMMDTVEGPISAAVEHWRKSIEIPQTATGEQHWVRVAKRRALRMRGRTRVERTHLELIDTQGLIVRGPTIQSTLALELLPCDDPLTEFEREIRALLASEPEHAAIARGWSGGYPGWLLRTLG